MLESKEDLIIEGRFDGEIKADKNCYISSQAQVNAQINAKNIAVYGSFSGEMTADDEIMVRKGSRVSGDLSALKILVDPDIQMNGYIKIRGN